MMRFGIAASLLCPPNHSSSPPQSCAPSLIFVAGGHSFVPLARFFSSAFIFTGLVVYLTFLSPHTPKLCNPNTSESTIPNDLPPPQPSSPISDILTLEQIGDIVAPTRGFFSRDFSLGLGWNNVSGVYCYLDVSY
jgi:hypothetical protein